MAPWRKIVEVNRQTRTSVQSRRTTADLGALGETFTLMKDAQFCIHRFLSRRGLVSKSPVTGRNSVRACWCFEKPGDFSNLTSSMLDRCLQLRPKFPEKATWEQRKCLQSMFVSNHDTRPLTDPILILQRNGDPSFSLCM
jgi:hypothetical protein